MKNYYLMTGCTGLLGRYLLRNYLQLDVPLAVIIRSTKLVSARQRLDTIICDLEEQLGRSLPRPVVLSGDLNSPGLGLSAESRAWLRANARGVIHNAASLSFESAPRTEEPWLTNLGGTQNVLEIAREAGLKDFHHVSTAYVCGKRTGHVYEHELNVGQEFGNDYEHSKLLSEQLIHDSTWLEQRTIYRPAIIVGDSVTGFTSTFHGFYTPLRIVNTVINTLQLKDYQDSSLLEVLGFAGHERKNLVPVDWIAQLMGQLFIDPKHHGLTYHLTPDQPVTISDMYAAMNEAVYTMTLDLGKNTAIPAAEQTAIESFLESFHDQMSVYQAYWRDDPQFDASNRQKHSPEIPCPMLSHETMLKLCRYAIQANFWCSRGDRITPSFDTGEFLEQKLARGKAQPVTPLESTALLKLSGCGGGDWRILLRDGQPVEYSPGRATDAEFEFSLGASTLSQLVRGELDPQTALQSGSIAVTCPRVLRTQVEPILTALTRA
jgi:thioester reductase-like protein